TAPSRASAPPMQTRTSVTTRGWPTPPRRTRCRSCAASKSGQSPALRDLGDLAAIALDLVLVIHDVPLRAQLAAVLDVDRKALAQRRDHRFLDGRHRLTPALDLHRVADAQLSLLGLEQLFSGRALEHERV